jgi:uncharacterized protein
MKPLTRTELEHKAIRFECKSLDDTGVFEGYASKFGNEDLGADIVVRGAFANSLKDRGIRGVKMLHEHDTAQPIGKWLDLVENDYGLYCKGKLLIEQLPKAKEVHALLKEQILDGLSIGFRVVKATSQRGNDAVRMLEAIDLREISTVMFPMNELSVITSVKHDLPTEREFQCWLQRDAQFSRSEAEHIIAHGLKSLLKAKRDAGGEVETADFLSQPPDAGLAALANELRRLNEATR